MGMEATCNAKFNGQDGVGKAQLETQYIAFKGTIQFKIPFDEIRSFQASGGALELATRQGPVELELGSKLAQSWYLKLRYPKTLIDKLGVKQDQLVSVIGVQDETFWKFLRQRTENIAETEPVADSDYVFLQVEGQDGLAQLPALESFIKRNGAIWVIWPKGQSHIKEDHIRAAAQEVRLVDVKVVSFSDRLSGLKLMIPVARR